MKRKLGVPLHILFFRETPGVLGQREKGRVPAPYVPISHDIDLKGNSEFEKWGHTDTRLKAWTMSRKQTSMSLKHTTCIARPLLPRLSMLAAHDSLALEFHSTTTARKGRLP